MFVLQIALYCTTCLAGKRKKTTVHSQELWVIYRPDSVNREVISMLACIAFEVHEKSNGFLSTSSLEFG